MRRGGGEKYTDEGFVSFMWVMQNPEGTHHVDLDSKDLMCSTCNVIMDHMWKESIDKHLLAKSLVNHSAESAFKRDNSVLRVNKFHKSHAKKRKVEQDDPPEDNKP